MAEQKKYPAYMYHKNEQLPVLANNKDDEQALLNKGYTRSYIHKDYPKWVNGKIVQSKEEHESLLAIPQAKVTLGPLPEEQGGDSLGERKGKAK